MLMASTPLSKDIDGQAVLKRKTQTGDVAQVVEYLSCKCKALSRNLSALPQKKKT
jgi:putative methionine-R-sulfoxide reductase with GAF domain